MRLHPIVGGVFRRALRDFDLGGFHIPKVHVASPHPKPWTANLWGLPHPQRARCFPTPKTLWTLTGGGFHIPKVRAASPPPKPCGRRPGGLPHPQGARCFPTPKTLDFHTWGASTSPRCTLLLHPQNPGLPYLGGFHIPKGHAPSPPPKPWEDAQCSHEVHAGSQSGLLVLPGPSAGHTGCCTRCAPC